MKKLAKREDQSVREYEVELWGWMDHTAEGRIGGLRDSETLRVSTSAHTLREGFEMLDMED